MTSSQRSGRRDLRARGKLASMTAEVTSSMLRSAISGSPYFDEMTSPRSVILMRPPTVPGGCARMAR